MVYRKPKHVWKSTYWNDAEIVKLQTELISDKELQKLQNKYENQYVNSNASIEGVAVILLLHALQWRKLNQYRNWDVPHHYTGRY
jgi:hypothetical protein